MMVTSYGFCGAVSMKDRKLVPAIKEPLRRMSWALIDYTDTKRNFGYYGQSFVVPLGIFDSPGLPSPTRIEGVLRTPSRLHPISSDISVILDLYSDIWPQVSTPDEFRTNWPHLLRGLQALSGAEYVYKANEAIDASVAVSIS